jgi:hypothetical protein
MPINVFSEHQRKNIAVNAVSHAATVFFSRQAGGLQTSGRLTHPALQGPYICGVSCSTERKPFKEENIPMKKLLSDICQGPLMLFVVILP